MAELIIFEYRMSMTMTKYICFQYIVSYTAVRRPDVTLC